MNTNEGDDLENSKELSQIGRKRRVAVDNQHLEKKDKIDKHMKLRKKNKPRKLYEKTYRNKKLDFADGAIDERIKVADHSDKNISSKGIGLETTNTEADIISFSDSKINLTDEEKDVGLTSSWFYNNDAKYNYNKAAKNVSKFKTKFGNIKFDKNAERNVKINNSESKKRSFIAKRQISNDNNKDTAYTLRSGTFRKISHKNSGETANEPFDLGDLKNFQSSESDRIEKEEISFEETEGPLKMNLKEVVSNSGNIYNVMKSSKDEENVWPSDGESAAEIGIIEQLPSLYGKIAFEDDFVFRDADGDPSSEVSFSTVEAETSVIRCTKVMSPILRKCCRPLLEALYALINDEQRPLDEPNLKRCDHFCYRAALKYCSPKAARITSSVIRKIKGYPLLGDVQFGAICNKTIHVALNYCCDLFVLNFYQGNYNYEEKTFKEPECAQVCQKSIFQLCFHFKPLQEYFKSLIKSYFRKKNILGLYTISTNSSQIFPVTQNKTLINAMLYRQIRTTFAPNLKYNYNEPCNTLSKSAANNLRHRRQVAAGTAYTRERKTSFHRKEAFRIPAHFKKLARMCIYMIQNSSLDNCVQGIYDYILMLSNGVKTNQPILTDISKASSCLGDVFNPCSTESILVLNSLLQQFLEDSINIINVTAMKRKGSIDEKTKEIVNLCLNRAGSDLINNCIGGFYSIIKEILDKGHSTIDIDLTNEGVKCLSEVLSICSLKARIALMRLMLEYEGVLLNISFMPQSDHINIMKLISGEEKRSFAECFKTLSQEEMNACEPELYSLLSELTKGSMRLLDVPLSGNKECLTDAFKKCSFHSRLVIMDLITFITDNTIDIPLHFPKETPVPITKEEQKVIHHCLSQLNPIIVDDCLPGFMYVLNEVYENNIPDLSKIPVRIAPASCLKNSFANCSADSRLFLTELVHRYTNVFVDLLFFISKDNIDQNLLNIASECIATIPVPLLNGCIRDLTTITEKLSSGFYHISELKIELKEKTPNCMNELFNRCSRYHRILIDQLMRKLTRSVTNTDMFDILHPLNIYSGPHHHTQTDMQLIQQCFGTVNEDYLNWCVPGLYEIIRSLTESNIPISVIALKPIEGSCLDMAFAECSYKSRILIKDLLYDFAYLFVNISLHGAPQGQTGELGPPIDAIQECIASVNSTGSDSCVLGIIASLHKIFIEKVENPQPIVSSDKEKTSMACLAELFKPCDLPVKVFLLKRIADISNVNVNFIMETFLIKSKADEKKKVIEENGVQVRLNPILKMRQQPLENHVGHRTANFAEIAAIQEKKIPFLNEISKLSAYQKEFGKTDILWYDKLRYKGIYPGEGQKIGCTKGNRDSMGFRARNTI
ncbi:uncharacterized protein LOC129975507 [Argiope bruennichi]|uniref:uncharacterized protein LOC129975507 n=1 Tax=Argiope bruennichi TaxID=94029 RepID=UPI0024953591|nr:uncharacterized protein LOC129975507 [Argiope bruennichi]